MASHEWHRPANMGGTPVYHGAWARKGCALGVPNPGCPPYWEVRSENDANLRGTKGRFLVRPHRKMLDPMDRGMRDPVDFQRVEVGRINRMGNLDFTTDQGNDPWMQNEGNVEIPHIPRSESGV